MTVKDLIKYLSNRNPKEKVYIVRTAWEEDYVSDFDLDDFIIGSEEHKKAKKNIEW